MNMKTKYYLWQNDWDYMIYKKDGQNIYFYNYTVGWLFCGEKLICDSPGKMKKISKVEAFAMLV